jgi:hypothetical protein
MGGAFWVTIIFLVITGVLACAGMIAAKKPDAGAIISKLVPFQGIIGVLALIWGVWNIIQILTSGMLSLFSYAPILMLLTIAAAVLMTLLGLLFGWSLIAKISGKADGGVTLAKLAGMQGPLGIATIIVAIALVILTVGGIAI